MCQFKHGIFTFSFPALNSTNISTYFPPNKNYSVKEI